VHFLPDKRTWRMRNIFVANLELSDECGEGVVFMWFVVVLTSRSEM